MANIDDFSKLLQKMMIFHISAKIDDFLGQKMMIFQLLFKIKMFEIFEKNNDFLIFGQN